MSTDGSKIYTCRIENILILDYLCSVFLCEDLNVGDVLVFGFGFLRFFFFLRFIYLF